MNKEMQAIKIYKALEKKGFDLDKAGFIQTITKALDSPAPDLQAENERLRAALEALVSEFENHSYCPDPGALHKARAALAKADG